MDKNKSKKLEQIVSDLSPNEYSFDSEIIKNYSVDWRNEYFGNSNLIAFPKTTKSLQAIVKKCIKNKISIVPQGGNTGLVGGSVPTNNGDEIIINLSKLNKIRTLNKDSSTITLESGCILEDIHKFTFERNYYFPVLMGSKGSCQIGGNIATNGGGLNVIKYGSLRNNIIGLEAILGDGTFYSKLKNIKKDNTGYDLNQLLIGSEGTLGIITAACIKLYPLAINKKVIFASFRSIKKILEFYSKIKRRFNDMLTSFEIINSDSMELVLTENKQLKRILKKNNFYCLIEISNFLQNFNFEDFLIENISKPSEYVNEIILSKSESENTKLWLYRELIPISEKNLIGCIKHDVSVPLEFLETFIKKTDQEIKKLDKTFNFINFGHIGDNNLHYNAYTSEKSKTKRLINKKKSINKIVFENVYKFNGSFSAEHGIGQLRKKELIKYKDKFEIEKMKAIKKIFDPNKIFNPGKVF